METLISGERMSEGWAKFIRVRLFGYFTIMSAIVPL
jgi:hypothetical protein